MRLQSLFGGLLLLIATATSMPIVLTESLEGLRIPTLKMLNGRADILASSIHYKVGDLVVAKESDP